MTAEERLADKMLEFGDDPLGFVMYAFPWGEGSLRDYSCPRKWQVELLDELGAWIRGGTSFEEAFKLCMKSGHGPGKSAWIGMVVMWAMSTMKDTRVVVTANTEGQLLKKTWPELSKWYHMCITQHWFKLTAMSLVAADPKSEKSWRADAIPWSETNPEAFAGLHNFGRRILVVFDEASAIPDTIWEVTEGAMTDVGTQIAWVCFGNPTRSDGMFRACFGRYRHVWRHKTVDTRTVEGINLKQIEQWVRDYGEDSDFVRVRVRGEFPKSSDLTLIGEGLAELAMDRSLDAGSYEFAPVVIGVDPAWTGEDSLEVVARQGLRAWSLESEARNESDVAIAGKIARHADLLDAEAIFIDGGYGTGIYSILKEQGYPVRIVWFNEGAIDKQYLNKRAEMWEGGTLEWLKNGGWIDCSKEDRGDWKTDLCSVRVEPDVLSGKKQLESKKAMRKRGESSPGKGDALALTFAFPVSSRGMKKKRERANAVAMIPSVNKMA